MAAAGTDVLMRGAVALVFVALLAGCGSSSGSSLEDAADATGAETSRFEVSYRPVGEKSDFSFEASGMFDYPNERGVMTVSEGGGGRTRDYVPPEFRLIGKTGYTRWLVDGKRHWVKDQEVESGSDPTELLLPYPGGPTTPTDVLTRVLLASDETTTLGTDDVRGTKTTHYRAKVDRMKLLRQLPPNKRDDAEEVGVGRFIPVEIWIDEDSRLRRLTLTENEGDDATAVITMELFDYGVEVDVQPPPDDELISQEEFDKLMEASADEDGCEAARENLSKKEADRMCLEMKEKE